MSIVKLRKTRKKFEPKPYKKEHKSREFRLDIPFAPYFKDRNLKKEDKPYGIYSILEEIVHDNEL